MLALLHGIRLLDFMAGDGSQVKGTQLFIGFAEDGVVGSKTDRIFLRDGFALPAVKPGDTLDIAFNNKGKPESVKLAAK